jgi:uncharacterized phage protein (TIGR01671 family)
MRQIKFRAWDNVGKEFIVEGFNLLGEVVLLGGFLQKGGDWFEQLGKVEIDQFIGLKSDAGLDIYEGDILDDEDGCVFLVFFDESLARFRIERFGINVYTVEGGQEVEGDFVNLETMDFDDIGERTIIGNIHQNPELLEGRNAR